MKPTQLPSVRFSTAFGITRGKSDDWFDPFLEQDTQLFVDPFLMAQDHDKKWVAAHERLVGFFNAALELLARSGGDRTSAHWRKASRLLLFPEPPEFCLGYSVATIFGHGTSRGMGAAMAHGAMDAIAAGLTHVDHLEDIALFGGGVGADVISDIVCNVLKTEFADYTRRVSKRHGVPTATLRTKHGAWSPTDLRWDERPIAMPENPVYPATGVLLVPERFLRELPVLDASTFWDWAYANVNETLREDLNYEISRHANRQQIKDIIDKRPSLVRRYIEERSEPTNPQPYNLRVDPKYKVRWFDDANQSAQSIPVTPPRDATLVRAFVQRLCEGYKDVVENHSGWELLWIGDRPRKERHAQKLFTATIVMSCKDAGIDVSPETDVGRGSVDFKFSFGIAARNYVEMKMASSSSFWNNLEHQLPTYLSAEAVDHGWLVIIQTRPRDLEPDFVTRVREKIEAVNSSRNITMVPIFVDATRKPTASKIRSN